MNPQPPRRFFGPGPIPLGNPSDGGSGGLGSDRLGTQFRDWRELSILAQIQTHGTSNAYSFRQMMMETSGAVTPVVNGITGAATTNPALEINGITTVNSGTVVELWPMYGPFPGWAFMSPGSAANVATTCKTVVTNWACSSGNAIVTYEVIRILAETCP